MAGLTVERIGRVTAPVLAVYGERSRCMPSGLALQSMGYPLRIVPGAGHFHPVTRQQLFLRAPAGFLRDLTRAGRLPQSGARARRPPIEGGETPGLDGWRAPRDTMATLFECNPI